MDCCKASAFASTAAEMTSNSVITDEVNQVKMVIIDVKQTPDIAVNDAELMVGQGQCLLRERNEVRYSFISKLDAKYPVSVACKVMRVSSSAYYTNPPNYMI